MRHGAAKGVRLPEAEVGERARHLQHLLLVEDDPVGLLQRGLQRRMQEGGGLFAVAAGEVGADHIGLHGSGTEEGDVGDDVVEAGGL